MADYLIQDTTLDAIANAINAKLGGTPGAMTPAQMVVGISEIPSGGGTKTLTKIAEYSITEPVNSISINIPESMRKYGGLYFNLKNVGFTDPYLYFGINGRGVAYYSVSTLGGSPINEGFSCGWVAGSSISEEAYSAVAGMTRKTNSSDRKTFVFSGDAVTFGFYPYTSSNQFTSGTIEVWGYV